MLKVSQQGNDEMGKLTYIRVQQQESNIHEARMVSSLAWVGQPHPGHHLALEAMAPEGGKEHPQSGAHPVPAIRSVTRLEAAC